MRDIKKIPMVYKINISSGPSIQVDSEEELIKIMEMKESVGKGGDVITRHGCFNPSHYASVTPDLERWDRLAQEYQIKGKVEIETPSEFAKLISKKMSMLNAGQKALVQDKADEGERRLNNG